MKDWKLLTLKALSPSKRAGYLAWMTRQAKAKRDPVEAVYARYAKLPADVAARCIHLDMQRRGWDDPPNELINEVCAERRNVAALLVLCAEQSIDGDEYVSEENRAEVYADLLKLHALADRAMLSKAAAAFCASTREGTPCQG